MSNTIMRHLIFMLATTLSVMLALGACSQEKASLDKGGKENPVCTDQRQANLILVNYLALDGDQYKLEISSEDAFSLGVPPKMYNDALSELE